MHSRRQTVYQKKYLKLTYISKLLKAGGKAHLKYILC